MGDGGKGGDENGGNVASAGYAVKSSHTVGIIIWDREFGGDRSHAKITLGIPYSVIDKDYGDYGAAYEDQRVGVAPSG